ncbi:MAG TPA: hypothetical protein VGE91_03440 [Solirubrobacterales bacterium]|jgi:hypothetical protein
MQRTRKVQGLLAAVAGLVAMIALAAPAQGATLSGPWAPFTRCPVDEPALLGSPANAFGTVCVASDSPSGTFTIGKTTVTTGDTNLQFGVSGQDPDNPNQGAVVPVPDRGSLVAAPAQVPGGLLGLICPSGNGVLQAICNTVVGSPLNKVTAAVELAGEPDNFNAAGALGTGVPVVTLPVKVHLENPVLGPNCYIGSDQDPIVLHPESSVVGTPTGAAFGGGFSGFIISISGSTLGDDSFAVPGASGCGGPLASIVNRVVNAKQHLPSPAGQNAVVLDDVTASTAITQQGGQVLHDAWHTFCESDC